MPSTEQLLGRKIVIIKGDGLVKVERLKEKTQKQRNKDFKFQLEHLINKFSQENRSNTPDFILSKYILHCLDAWESAIKERDKWYNK